MFHCLQAVVGSRKGEMIRHDDPITEDDSFWETVVAKTIQEGERGR